MNKPKLSVIVPIWGVEKYIEKCARSLFESTLDDIEFIFVDDCTPDKSVEVLKSIMDFYPKRKAQSILIRHETNKGLPQARKTGFEASHGEWITYVDSDDWIDPKMYERLFEKVDNESRTDLIFCDFVFLSDTEVIWRPTYNCNQTSDELRMNILLGRISNAVWNKIVNRRIYDNNIFFPKFSMDEDDVLTVQWTYYSKRICYVPECLYYHFANPESMTHEIDKNKIERHLNEQIENRKWIVGFLEANNEPELDYVIYLYKFSVKHLFTRLHGMTSRNIYKDINRKMIFDKRIVFSQRIKNLLFLYSPLRGLLLRKVVNLFRN